MTQEEKQLLLKDLCGRQFYGTKILGPWEKDGPCELSAIDLTSSRQIRVFEDWFKIEEVKPYLRLMSSMTEDERKELCELCEFFEPYNDRDDFSHYGIEIIEEFCVNDEKIPLREINYEVIDWLNAHHFDYRGLIEKGLALKAPEGMYKTE